MQYYYFLYGSDDKLYGFFNDQAHLKNALCQALGPDSPIKELDTKFKLYKYRKRQINMPLARNLENYVKPSSLLICSKEKEG